MRTSSYARSKGVTLPGGKGAQQPMLTGQQRLTSLIQVLKLEAAVTTCAERKREIKGHYYIDIELVQRRHPQASLPGSRPLSALVRARRPAELLG